MNANPSKYLSSDYPVSNVSWNDAVEFCRRLTESERKLGIIAPGLRYRLPTEAEWEYCCRAGSTTEYCFGDDPKGLYYYMLYSGSSLEQVGANKANAWGLSEMHGNVWEWCQDWYGPYSQDEQTDPTGPATGEFRTLRGGSSASGAYHCRSAFRGKVAPADRNDIAECGFRVVLAEEQAGK
ncbi:MAG: formylglycine-generating enzyme family protein, partial [Candidatus Brocadiia bacterium]